MKIENFKKYTIDVLIEIRRHLVNCYKSEENIPHLPVDIFTYLNKEYADTGNLYTRIGRCITLVDMELANKTFDRVNKIIIPVNDVITENGYFTLNQVANLLRKYKDQPQTIQFLAEMLEE